MNRLTASEAAYSLAWAVLALQTHPTALIRCASGAVAEVTANRHERQAPRSRLPWPPWRLRNRHFDLTETPR